MKLKDYLYYSEDKVKLYNANCLEILKKLPDNYIDLIVTDPPYGYSFMGKDWDTFNEVKDIQKEFSNTVYAKKGFKKLPRNKPFGMIKFFVPIWKEVLRVLKPGAFAFIMCAPRQDVLSKQIVALQEAGFETGFSSIYWSYATGFPKASNIGKKIDKRRKGENDGTAQEFAEYIKLQRKKLNLKKSNLDKIVCNGSSMYSFYEGRINERGYFSVYLPNKERYRKLKKVLKLDDRFDEYIENTQKIITKEKGDFGYQKGNKRWDKDYKITISNSPQAKKLDGSYGGFQPKPAVEIIIVAMKPLSEKTYVDQALKNGKGITWLDNCRVPYESEKDKEKAKFGTQTDIRGNAYNKNRPSEGKIYAKNVLSSQKGRFPANLLVSDDVLNDGGNYKTGNLNRRGNSKYWGLNGQDLKHKGSSGSYSRYFDLDLWWRERAKKLSPEVQKVFPYLIVAKASKREKNKGCENLEDKQQGLEAKNRVWSDKCGNCGLKFIGGEPRCHCPAESKKTDKKGGYQYKNNHPTVKPIKLMSYLITLGSREKDIVLDPFVGSGTTLIASKLLNRKGMGIEMSKEYCNIAKARVKGWSK